MPKLTAPAKTPAGQDELRHRTRGLGQRYRTVLLLVDGRRPLGDVLAMANKAGAQTSHFEELVRLGLVEIPDEAQAAEPVDSIAGALDTPRLTSVDVDVYPEPALTPMGELLPDEDEEAEESRPLAASEEAYDESDDEPQSRVTDVVIPHVVAAEPPAHAAPAVAPTPTPVPVTAPPPAPVRPTLTPAQRAAAALAVAKPPAPVAAPYVEPVIAFNDAPRAPEWVQQARETPFRVADHARPVPKMTEDQRLQNVRDLLIDTVRQDSLFATFSLGRVRSAVTHKELIKLVWELERERVHARRSREQLLNLQRARELLGMGNTLVAGDSQPGMPSEY